MRKMMKRAVLEGLESRVLLSAGVEGYGAVGVGGQVGAVVNGGTWNMPGGGTRRYRAEAMALVHGMAVPTLANGMHAAQAFFNLLHRGPVTPAPTPTPDPKPDPKPTPDPTPTPPPVPVPVVANLTGLKATAEGAGVCLQWTKGEGQEDGVTVWRSLDGATFTQVGTVAPGDGANYLDATALHGRRYYYEVQGYVGAKTSDMSNLASAVIALAAPSGLTASLGANSVVLGWTDNDAGAMGYTILRSSDGGASYYAVGQVNMGSATGYSDTALFAGRTYEYEVEAVGSEGTSGVSNAASEVAPGGMGSTIGTRYDYDASELVVNANGAADTVSVTQMGSILTITIDGTASMEALPAAGVFIYTRGGADRVTIDGSVTVRTTVETIDYGATTIVSGGADVSVWMDSTDVFSGTGVVHRVAGFAGAVSKGYRASLANPSDLRMPFEPDDSLWGTGPTVVGVNQGGAGDCYYLAGLAGMAAANPDLLREAAVDMGDGTYVVRCYRMRTQEEYVRVSNVLDMSKAQMGQDHTVWALVMEKAFCFERGGVNSYASLWGGTEVEAFLELQGNYTTFSPSSYGDAGMYTKLAGALANGRGVALSSDGGAGLLADHSYSLMRVYQDGAGVRHYVVRNPWGPGHVGLQLEDFNGVADLTWAQFMGNFNEGAMG